MAKSNKGKELESQTIKYGPYKIWYFPEINFFQIPGWDIPFKNLQEVKGFINDIPAGMRAKVKAFHATIK